MDSNGNLVQNALIEVGGRSNLNPFRTDRNGEYYKLLLPGIYTFTVTYPGHKALTETISVPYGPDTFSAFTQNFLLQKLDYGALITQLPVSTTTSIKKDAENNSASLLANTVTALAALIIQRLLLS